MVAIEADQRTSQISDYYAFGQLLAYCFYFGLQDIHKDNLLICRQGLQVVDVEQAFSDLILPNQTLLLPPNRHITWSAGLNLLTTLKIEQLVRPKAKILVEGFNDLTSIFINEHAAIRSVLLSSLKEFEQQPIRIFFRGTKEYAEDLLGETMIPNCIAEEKTQLDRGDIPYFFMFLGKRQVYFYSSEYWDVEEVKVPENFQKFITYTAKNPTEFFIQSNVEQQWARGMLFLAKKSPSLTQNDLNWKTCSIVRSADQLNFASDNLKMVAKI